MDSTSVGVEHGSMQAKEARKQRRKASAMRFAKRYRNRLLKKDSKKFAKYIKSTSTHGVKYIFFGKSIIRRIFWAVLFLAALAGCLYNVVINIRTFVKTPTSTTVSSVHVTDATFPAVTICNMNSFRTSYLEEHNLTSIVRATIDLKLTSRSTLTQEFTNQCQRFKDHNSDIPIERVLREGGQGLEEFIVQCDFAGVPCNLSEDFTPYMTPTGLCYTFNGKREDGIYKRIFGGGARHDLELILNVRQHEFTSVFGQETGAIVTIHHPEEPPAPFTNQRVIPIGKSAYMAISQRQIVDLSNTANSDCFRGDLGTGSLISSQYNYSLPACLINCTQSHIAELCGCLPTDFIQKSSYSNLAPCNITQLCCIAASLTISESCGCTIPCNHSQYEVTTTYATFPTLSEVDVIADQFNTTPEIVGHSFIKVHVFFSELFVVKEITERSYTLTALVADIGGAMGLFLGASIISLTELLMWIFDEIKDRCFGIKEETLVNDFKKSKQKLPTVDNSDLVTSFTSMSAMM